MSVVPGTEGPAGRRHWPAWTDGCQRTDASEACLVCRGRSAVAPLPGVVPDTVVTVAVATLVTLAGVALHEAAHIGWFYGVTGRLPTCASGLPIHLTDGMLRACTGRVTSAGLLLAGPVVGGLFGIAAMVVSPRREGPTRVGLFGGGALFWLYNALYGLGWLHVVYRVDGDVVLVGDGVQAIQELGYLAQLPGLVLLGVGVLALVRLVEFRD